MKKSNILLLIFITIIFIFGSCSSQNYNSTQEITSDFNSDSVEIVSSLPTIEKSEILVDPFDNPRNWEGIHPIALINGWHSEDGMGAVPFNRYLFLDNGTFYFVAPQISADRLRYMDGTWYVENMILYLTPQRQKLLKIMEQSDCSMTPKEISLVLKVSPSSVTYHLKKLQEIGLVDLDFTKKINGIQANYYKKIPANVNLKGNVNDDLQTEKILILDYIVNDTLNDFKKYLYSVSSQSQNNTELLGDSINGTFYLTDDEVIEIKSLLKKFSDDHSFKTTNSRPWKINIITFPQ